MNTLDVILVPNWCYFFQQGLSVLILHQMIMLSFDIFVSFVNKKKVEIN